MEASSANEIGQRLYEERIRRRLSVDEVADSLKMRREYVLALEQGQWDTLPGEVYAQGFCRSYARLLDLNAESLLEPRRVELEDLGQAPPSHRVRTVVDAGTGRVPMRSRSNRRRVATRRGRMPTANSGPTVLPGQSLAWLLVVILVLTAGGLWLSNRAPKTHVAPPAGTPSKVKSTPSTAPPKKSTLPKKSTVPPSAKTGVAPIAKPPRFLASHFSKGLYYADYRVTSGRPVKMVLTFIGTCWVAYWVNGTLVNAAGHTYSAGERLQLSGSHSLAVSIGNVFGVKVSVDGSTVGQIAQDSKGHSSILTFTAGA
ncbi:MAG: helix-turn-helix domain-containing protein [Firmicutes bacterium]|nr:helix-turn-helix domain-containing protein [Bacillota bacterium]MCL5063589.1 helix-turn-helix domain-containing protein [Bacillota bacterium]